MASAKLTFEEYLEHMRPWAERISKHRAWRGHAKLDAPDLLQEATITLWQVYSRYRRRDSFEHLCRRGTRAIVCRLINLYRCNRKTTVTQVEPDDKVSAELMWQGTASVVDSIAIREHVAAVLRGIDSARHLGLSREQMFHLHDSLSATSDIVLQSSKSSPTLLEEDDMTMFDETTNVPESPDSETPAAAPVAPEATETPAPAKPRRERKPRAAQTQAAEPTEPQAGEATAPAQEETTMTPTRKPARKAKAAKKATNKKAKASDKAPKPKAVKGKFKAGQTAIYLGGSRAKTLKKGEVTIHQERGAGMRYAVSQGKGKSRVSTIIAVQFLR